MKNALYKMFGLPDPYNAEAGFSLLVNRMFMAFISILIILILVIISLASSNNSLTKELIASSKNKVMIGLQNENGYFISADSLPVAHVNDWARTWISHWTDISRENYISNINFAEQRMSDSLKEELAIVIATKKKIIKEQGIRSTFNILSVDIEPTPGEMFAFKVTIRGIYEKKIGGKPISEEKRTYTLNIDGVNPSATNPLAIAVYELNDPDFKK